MSPLEAKSGDIFEKMWKVGAELWRSRGDQVIRLPGCPVSVAEQVLALVHLGGLDNPYFDPEVAVQFTSCYAVHRARDGANWSFGKNAATSVLSQDLETGSS